MRQQIPTLIPMLFALLLMGCGKVDPNAKYLDLQLVSGASIASIKEQLGEPDSYTFGWSSRPNGEIESDSMDAVKARIEQAARASEGRTRLLLPPPTSITFEEARENQRKWEESLPKPVKTELLKYGPFTAYSQQEGDHASYRLSLVFVDGKLHEWEKRNPRE